MPVMSSAALLLHHAVVQAATSSLVDSTTHIILHVLLLTVCDYNSKRRFDETPHKDLLTARAKASNHV